MSSPAAAKPTKPVAASAAATAAPKPPVKLARVRAVCGLDLSGRTTFESLSRETLDGAVLKVRAEFPSWNDRMAKKAIRKTLSRRVRNLKKGLVGKDLRLTERRE